MRSTTAGQDSSLAALNRKDLLRVSVKDGAGVFQHYTRIGGGERDWVRSWQVERDADQPAGRFNVSLHPTSIVARYAADVVASTDTFTSQGHGLANGDTVYVDGSSLPTGLSANTLYYVIGVSGDDYKLSATRGGSAVDVTANGSCSVVHTRYIAPTSSTASANDIKEGRDILIECAVVDIDTADADVAAGEWEQLLSGRLDGTEWPENVGTWGRDDFGRLLDEWVETPTVYATGGVAQETVMQSIVTDHLSVALTLDVPVSPSFTVNEYENRIQSVADALIAHSNLTGWTIHDLWDDGSSAWVTRYYEPDRNKTTPDRTIDSDDYYVVGDIRRDTSSVQNVGIMGWQAGSFVTVEDTSSITEFGRLPIFGDATGDPQIDTSGKATTLITAAVNDLAEPLVRAEIRGPLYWPVQLGDLITFTADIRHLEEDTDFAVTGFVHRGDERGNETIFRLRGKPSGGVDRWHRFFRKTRQKQEVEDLVPDLGVDTVVPSVDLQRSQSGSVGTLTLDIDDPDGVVNAVAFETHTGGGDFDFTTDPTTWTQFDDTSPFVLTETVALAERHNAFIAWAVRYDLGDGLGNRWRRSVEVYDPDVIPSFAAGLHQTGASVWLSWLGDEDLGSIRYAISTSSMPTSGDVSTGTVSAGRSSDGVEIKNDLAEGETLYVRVRGFTDATGGGTASAEDWRERVERPTDTVGVRPPVVRVSRSQAGGTGTLSLVVNDPDGVMTASAFDEQAGGGDYSFNSDPALWNVFDNAAPFTLSEDVALQSKHTSVIVWGVRYDLGEGAGEQWAQGSGTFDADLESAIRAVTLGFSDGGQAVVTVVGDEDTKGIIFELGVGSDPGAISLGASSTTTNAEAAGSTSLEVDAAIGQAAQDWLLVSGSGGAELVRATGGGNPVPIAAPGLVNSYDAGATVSIAQDNSTNTGGVVQGQSGTVTTDDSTGVADFTADIGDLIYCRAVGFNSAGTLGAQELVSRRRGDTDKVQPKVHVTGTKSSGDASITFDVTDPTLAVSSIAYKRRDQDTQTEDGTWQTSWTSSTGTVGVDETLSRTITIGDPYGALLWRIEWTDENGTTQEIGDEIDLASIQDMSKEQWTNGYEFAPANSADAHSRSGTALTNDSGAQATFVARAPVVNGVTLTEVSARAGGTFEVRLVRTSTTLATLTSGTPASLNEDVSDGSAYRFEVDLADGSSISGVDLSYTSPSYKQTY